jgi:hypothetical protein
MAAIPIILENHLSQNMFSNQNGKYSLPPPPTASIGQGHERFADG